MEKKTKLTITLALAVLVITLSLGAAISIAPNETGAQTTVPIQPEIELQIQPEIAAPIQPEIEKAQFGACCPTSGVFSVPPPHPSRIIYVASPDPADEVLVTITCTYTNTEGGLLGVAISPFGNVEGGLPPGNSFTLYGRVTEIRLWAAGTASLAEGEYEIKIVEP